MTRSLKEIDADLKAMQDVVNQASENEAQFLLTDWDYIASIIRDLKQDRRIAEAKEL